MKPISAPFGRRLCELRQQQGLKRRDLAARSGIKASYLEKIERGYCPPPSAITIRALAKVLQADADELFCLSGKIPPDVERDLICSPLLVQVLRVASQWDAEKLRSFLCSQGVDSEKLQYRSPLSRWEICDERQVVREPITEEMKRAVFKLDSYECVYCSSLAVLQVDHVFPISCGGTDEIENLVTCCSGCNLKKTNHAKPFPMVFGRFRTQVESVGS